MIAVSAYHWTTLPARQVCASIAPPRGTVSNSATNRPVWAAIALFCQVVELSANSAADGAAGVVAVTGALAGDRLPAASTATTAKVYVVAALRPPLTAVVP